MCFQCRALGTLVNAGRDKNGRFNCCKEVAHFDFRPSMKVAEHMKDTGAAIYLRDTISLYAAHGISFVPIRVEDDGSCLPHAISRALLGHEVLFDAIRLDLMYELRENPDFYKRLFHQGMDDQTWDLHWQQVCEEATPTFGERTDRWLGPEHILGISNVLRRPILVLDTPERMANDADIGCGMFLPYRLLESGSKLCENLQPIVVAWASGAHNHFVCMVQPEHDLSRIYLETLLHPDKLAKTLDLRGDLLTTWTKVLNLKRNPDHVGEEYRVPQGAKGGDIVFIVDPCSYILTAEVQSDETAQSDETPQHPANDESQRPRLLNTSDESITNNTGGAGEPRQNVIPLLVPQGARAGDIVHSSVPSRFTLGLLRLVLNPSACRARAMKTLLRVLSNVMDAVISGDFDKLQRVGTLPMDNPNVVRNVLNVPGARMCLEGAGFVEDVLVSDTCTRRALCIKSMNRDANLADCVEIIRELQVIQSEQPDSFQVFTKLAPECRVSNLEIEIQLFGNAPIFYHAWHTAQPSHGNQSNEKQTPAWHDVRALLDQHGFAWEFGIENRKFLPNGCDDHLVSNLKDDMECVTLAEFGDWDEITALDRRSLRCPRCHVYMEWPQPHALEGAVAEATQGECLDCGASVDVTMTLHHRMLRRIGCFARGELGTLWRCYSCKDLFGSQSFGLLHSDASKECLRCNTPAPRTDTVNVLSTFVTQKIDTLNGAIDEHVGNVLIVPRHIVGSKLNLRDVENALRAVDEKNCENDLCDSNSSCSSI